MTHRYAYFLDGPKQGQTMRIPPDWTFLIVAVPRERSPFDLMMNNDIPKPIQHDTVTYRQTDYGRVTPYLRGFAEEWSIEGRPEWALEGMQ